MTRDKWADAFFAEFSECCDCDYRVAVDCTDAAVRAQGVKHGPDVSLWDDPHLTVQGELATWEKAA